MSDLYSELLVKKKSTVKDTIIKVGCIGLTAISVAAGIVIHPICLAAAIILGVITYFVLPKLDVEYEYLHVNGELDIDKIFAKQTRKRAISLDMKDLEILAPIHSHRLDSYKNNRNIRTYDFSSQDENHKIYAIIIAKEQNLLKVLVELNDTMLEDIKKQNPRKVFTD